MKKNLVLKKYHEAAQMTKKIAVPALRWWNLKNWNSASDLFLKLLSIVALLLAADFFLLKSAIVWDVKYLDKIDYNKIKAFYANEGKEIPEFLDQALSDYLYRIDYTGQTGIIARSRPINPDAYNNQYYLNLSNYTGYGDEELLAWLAIKATTVTIGKITITNNGNAPASKIQILPPPQFKLSESTPQSFDLPPNASVTIWMDAGKKYDFEPEYMWGDHIGQAPIVNVVWDESYGLINKKLFVALVSLVTVIWASVIIKDIWFSTEKSNE